MSTRAYSLHQNPELENKIGNVRSCVRRPNTWHPKLGDRDPLVTSLIVP
jgi:hypothetical protein